MIDRITGRKFGPIALADGVLPRHALGFYLAGFFGLCIVTFINSGQPFLLEAVMNIPKSEQGPLVGRLNGFQEIVVILTAGFVGAYSDRIERRNLYGFSFIMLAIGFFVYPLINSVVGLYLGRFLFALGISAYAVALASLAADYPKNDSRGKFLALQVVVQGMSIFVFARPVLGQLAVWYGEAGYDPVMVGRFTFWSVAGLALANSIICFIMLKPGRPVDSEQQQPIIPMLKKGLAYAANKPPLGLSYFAAFATRGDFAVITAFLSLWFVQAGTDPAKSTGDFFARFGAIQVVAVLWAPIMAIILDKINRVSGVALAMAIATVTYSSLILVDDPTGSTMWICVVLLGIAESSTIMSGNALVGEYAPPEERGNVLGVYTVLGGFGIFASSVFGGMAFKVTPAGPFLFMAVINFLVLIVALRVRKNM